MQNDVKVSDRYKAKYKSIDNESFISIPSFPNKNMILEVTNRCNHNCIFCYHYKMTTRQCDIDENLAIRVIHEAYELGMREIGFSKSGEPFLNSNLNQYINEAHNTGYEYIYLTTNGQLVTKERLKSAVESGLNSIKFSINAVNKRDYEFIHGVDAFEIVLQNLRDAYSYRKESGNKFKIFVSYVETKYTIKSREEIYNLFSPYCDEVLILAAWNLGGYNPEVRTELSTPQMDVDYDSSRTVPCPVPFNAVTITANGFLTGCCVECQDYLAVADLSKNTLLQAWECRTFSEYRNRHINKDISNLACMNCIYNSQIVPQPLNKDLCASFDAGKMFNPEVVKSRINKYLEAETEE